MSVVQFNFPVLIEQQQSKYTVQPLLMNGLTVSRKRYGDALRGMQREVRKNYNEDRMERNEIEEFLWYCFDPKMHFEVLRLAFKTGMHYVDGKFALARYQVGQQKFVCLPKLDHLTLRVPDQLSGRQANIVWLEAFIGKYFRELRENEEGFDPSRYFSSSKDVVANVSGSLNIQHTAFPFEGSGASLFAFFSDQTPFRGAKELGKVGENWNLRYPDELEHAMHREAECDWLYHAVFESPGLCVALVGQDGVGKSTIVQQVLRHYREQHQKLSAGRQQQLWFVDPLRVISGMSIVGQWERRFEAILSHLRDRLPDTFKIQKSDILYIDNPVALFRVGKSSQTSLTLAHVLKPYLERQQVPTLLEMTAAQWQRLQEFDRGFADLFQVLRVPPLDAHQLDDIVTRLRANLELEYACVFSTASYLKLIQAEQQVRGERALPGSLVQLARNIANRYQGIYIEQEHIYATLESNFSLRRELIDRSCGLNVEKLTHEFALQLIGQPRAVEALVDTVVRLKSQLNVPRKPINSLLFIGPTGVGKTEAAKLLTRYLYNREECLVRIDMNEYIDSEAVHRLIGSLHSPHGVLTERVRYQKSCVLLLDEIEKAHPRVHDVLLQLLDDGRLTDALGQTTDFSQTIVIMTSNLGAQEAAKSLGFMGEAQDNSAVYHKSAEQFFRPEFFNRINQVVCFATLGQADMLHLADLHLGKLLQRDGFARRNTIFKVERDLLATLAEKGYDKQLGARALKRFLEKALTQSTAQRMAVITENSPIILTLQQRDSQLQAAITQLRYSEKCALPYLTQSDSPSMTLLEGFISELQRCKTRLHNGGSAVFEGSGTVSDAKWTLSDGIKDILEPLERYRWEWDERALTQDLQIRLPYQPKVKLMRGGWRGSRIDFSAVNAYHDIRDYLSGVYQQAENLYPKRKRDALSLTLDVAYIEHLTKSYVARGSDSGRLIVRSLLLNEGEQAVNYLIDLYQLLISEFGTVVKKFSVEDGVGLEFSSIGVHELFAFEQGIHLFFSTARRHIPVLLSYESASQEPTKAASAPPVEAETLSILRLYVLPEFGMKNDTITDLRTGLMCDSNIALADLRLLTSPVFMQCGSKAVREE